MSVLQFRVESLLWWEILTHLRGVSFIQKVLIQCLVDTRLWGES